MKTRVAFIILFILLVGADVYSQWRRVEEPHCITDKIGVLGSDLYVYSPTDGILRSSDTGKTWVVINTSVTDSNTSTQWWNMEFGTLDNALFAANRNGVIRTTDNGISWIDSDNGITSGISCFVSIDSTIIGGSYRGFFLSTNKGNSWINSSTGAPDSNLVYCLFNFASFVIAGTVKGIFRSDDSGKSWTKTSSNLVDRDGYHGYTRVFEHIDSILFAGSPQHLFHRSLDNGVTWTLTAKSVFPFSMSVLDTVLFSFETGAYGAAHLSRDYGTSWEKIELNFPLYKYPSSVVIGEHLFVTGKDGSYFTTNMGSSWTPSLQTEPIYGFSKIGKYLFACSDKGAIKRSEDNGFIWSKLNIGRSDLNVNVIGALDTILYAGTNSGLFQSKDAGESWVQILPSKYIVTSIGAENNVLWVGTRILDSISRNENGVIFRSNDNGQSWQNQIVAPTTKDNSFNSFAFKGTMIFANSNHGGVFRSTNNGESWGLTSMDRYWHYPTKANGLVFNDPYLFVSRDDGIFRSSDDGDTWIYTGRGCPNPCYSLIAYDTIIFASTINGVYKMSLNDTQWTYINTGLDTKAGILSLFLDGSNLFAGTNGSGIWRRPLAEVNVNKNQLLLPSAQIGNNYPNPFVQKTIINFSLVKPQQITIKIFNALGKEIATLATGKFYDLGMQSIEWDAKDETPGIYICRLFLQDDILAKPIILTK